MTTGCKPLRYHAGFFHTGPPAMFAPLTLDAAGWVHPARHVPSPNHDAQPEPPCLLVVHHISLPPGQFGGDDIERLFTNTLDPNAHPDYHWIAALRVSAQHGLWLPVGAGGALGRAAHLADTCWGGARWMRGARGCTYHHILLPRHALIRAEGLWAESFWPGRDAIAALSPAARFGLIRALPRLAGAVFGATSPETLYGPRACAVLQRKQIDHAACANWSRIARQMTHFDGFVTETVGASRPGKKAGFAG